MHLSSAFLLHVSGGSREDVSTISVLLVGKLRNEGLPKVRAGDEPRILIAWSLEIEVAIGKQGKGNA